MWKYPTLENAIGPRRPTLGLPSFGLAACHRGRTPTKFRPAEPKLNFGGRRKVLGSIGFHPKILTSDLSWFSDLGMDEEKMGWNGLEWMN